MVQPECPPPFRGALPRGRAGGFGAVGRKESKNFGGYGMPGTEGH